MRVTTLAAALAAAATPGLAAPITLSPGEATRSEADAGLTGVFGDTGFEYSATSRENLDGEDFYDIERINDGPTGVDTTVDSLTIFRSNGAAFDLDALDIPVGYAIEAYEIVGTSSDPDVEDFASFDIASNVVTLTGETVAGGTVSTTFTPRRPGDGDVSDFGFWSPDDPIFGPETFGTEFTDLVSLTLAGTVGGGPVELCSDVNLAALPDDAAEICDDLTLFGSVDAPEGSIYDSFSVEFAAGGFRNDEALFALDGVTVTPSEVAPIPLPASLPLLAGAIGLLARRARRWPYRR